MASSDTLLSFDLDAALARVSAGEPLSAAALAHLAASPDILPIGMLADAVRRHVAGTQVTFLRVALIDGTRAEAPIDVPAAAREIRVTGAPEALDAAVACVAALRAAAGDRAISGFSWSDIERWAGATKGAAAVLTELRTAGLGAVAEFPLDLIDVPEKALEAIAESGLRGVRLTIAKAATLGARLPQFLQACALSERFPLVSALAPLPMSLNPLRPTTGYDDVKAVALARLAVPRVRHIQVDWLRYGPKLAQVALTFGADDLDNVSAIDDAPDGHRRSVVEELKRNVQSAGFTAVERDGRFGALA